MDRRQKRDRRAVSRREQLDADLLRSLGIAPAPIRKIRKSRSVRADLPLCAECGLPADDPIHTRRARRDLRSRS
jgi:hypothetical protein